MCSSDIINTKKLFSHFKKGEVGCPGFKMAFLFKIYSMATGKKKVIVYADWKSTFELLSDEEAGKLIKHFFRYVNDEDPEPPERLIEILFEPIKVTLKRDLEKWEIRSGNAKANGLKGGRPKSENNPKEPTRLFLAQKKPVSVSVSDSVSVSVKENNSLITSVIKECVTEKTASRKFVKPTRQEIQDFIILNSFVIDPDYFINHYESNGWKVGKNSMKDWKATLRNWNTREKENQKSKPQQKNYDDNFRKADGSIDHEAKRQAFVRKVLGTDQQENATQKFDNIQDIGFIDVSG
jgi:hypothetical protein